MGWACGLWPTIACAKQGGGAEPAFKLCCIHGTHVWSAVIPRAFKRCCIHGSHVWTAVTPRHPNELLCIYARSIVTINQDLLHSR